MKKTKYEVHKRSGLFIVYVTEKRNSEDMLQRIIDQHQNFDEIGLPIFMKVVQVVGNERKVIYTPKDYKFWKENLVLS